MYISKNILTTLFKKYILGREKEEKKPWLSYQIHTFFLFLKTIFMLLSIGRYIFTKLLPYLYHAIYHILFPNLIRFTKLVILAILTALRWRHKQPTWRLRPWPGAKWPGVYNCLIGSQVSSLPFLLSQNNVSIVRAFLHTVYSPVLECLSTVHNWKKLEAKDIELLSKLDKETGR